MREDSVYSTSACATRQGSNIALDGEPSRNARDSAKRSADQAAGPRAISALSESPAAACAGRVASPLKTPRATAAARSTICSPIATPPRKTSFVPRRRNTASGRFWIGNSVSAALADSTQLRSAGSWVSLSVVMTASAPSGGQAAVVHPGRVLGRALGLGPLIEHVPLHLVELLHHLGGAGVGGQFQAVAVRVEEIDRLEDGVVGRAE